MVFVSRVYRTSPHKGSTTRICVLSEEERGMIPFVVITPEEMSMEDDSEPELNAAKR